MRLNTSAANTLLYLLSGATTAADVSGRMPEKDIRSIQRSFERLMDIGLLEKKGPQNNPSYGVKYDALLIAGIPEKIFDDEGRPDSGYNRAWIEWLQGLTDSEVSDLLGDSFSSNHNSHKMTNKELEYLTVELSWKSSALEGNTYTLLDTQLLLTEGIKAKGRTEFETQMILNHKRAIDFIVENPEQFNQNISFAAVEEIHKIIGDNLGISSGVRKRLVRISASNYVPLSNPHQLREAADAVLTTINHFSDAYVRAFMALGLVPYLQTFEDGNKRTGRILANAIMISSFGRGFSLRNVDARKLALAYLALYEFNTMKALSDIFTSETKQ